MQNLTLLTRLQLSLSPCRYPRLFSLEIFSTGDKSSELILVNCQNKERMSESETLETQILPWTVCC